MQEIKYAVAGRHPETGARVNCELGWSPIDDYFFIDGDGGVINNKRFLGELHLASCQWRVWDDLRVFQAMRRAEIDWWIANNPGSAATEELRALQAGRRSAVVA